MTEKPFRCHISIVLEQASAFIWVLVVFVFSNIDDVIRLVQEGQFTFGFSSMLVLGLLVILLLFFGIQLWKWYRTWLQLDPESFVIEKQGLIKQRMTIGLGSISNVNVSQNIFERLLGTCQLKMDTNSASTADKTDVKIVLKKQVAEEIKQTINQVLAQQKKELILPPDQDPKIGVNKEESPEVMFSFGQVLQYSLLSIPLFSAIFFLAIAGIGGFVALTPGLRTAVLENIGSFALASVISIVPMIYNALKGIVRYYGFQAQRKGDKIYLSYGLFTQKTYTIPVDKINALVIRQPTFARISRKYCAELINIGIGDDATEGSQLLLMCKSQRLTQLLQQLLPEYAAHWELAKGPAQSRSALVPLAIQSGLVAAGLLVIIGFSSIILQQQLTAFSGLITALTWAAGLLVIGGALLQLVLQYMTKGLEVHDGVLRITDGVFQKKIVLALYAKIQRLERIQGPVSAKLGLEKGTVYVLASMINRAHAIGFFPSQQFNQISCHMIRKKA